MTRLILLIGTARDVFLAFELLSAGENGRLTLGELAKNRRENEILQII